MNIGVIGVLWMGATFGLSGAWASLGISLGAIVLAMTLWAIWMRVASGRAGVPVRFQEWRDHVDRARARARNPEGPRP